MIKNTLVDLSRRLLPDLSWRRRVTRANLRDDAMAALIGAVVVVPQGIAFATLAGLPPEYGLYCAMVPAIVGALFGSSWHLVSGPTNAISLVVFATLSPLAATGSAQYAALALTLALMVGILQLTMGLARLGTLINFVSHSVVVGFTAGAGVLIIVAQINNFFGLALPRGSLPQTLGAFAASLGDVKPWVVAVGILTIVASIVARRFLPRVPHMVVALLAGGVFGWILNRLLGKSTTGIAEIGLLPGALPALTVPEFDAATFGKLLGVAVAVAVLGLVEAVSISRAIAARSGQRIDGNREFVGQGLSNIAGSFFGAYPSSGSFNRSGLNYDSGAKTPLAAMLSAPMLVVVLLVISPLLAYLPLAAMAGLLFMVALNLIDLRAIRHVLSSSRQETAVLAITFAATLFAELEFAILFGVTLSLTLYLKRTSRPALRPIVPDAGSEARKFKVVEPGQPECPQLKILRLEGSLYFGAVNHVATELDDLREAAPGQKHLLLLVKGMNFVDVAGADLLAEERMRRRAAGGELYLHGLRPDAAAALERTGYMRGDNRKQVFARKRDALADIVPRLDPRVCATCTARIFEECAAQPGPPPREPEPPA
ncbi:MAG: SulP family inorganic anion transporter [Burkholderiales bacterium]